MEIRLRVFKPNDACFKCPCSRCRGRPDLPGISELLVEKLNHIQKQIYDDNMPLELVPTSGRRCKEHNAEIPHSAPDSMHLRGLAVDLATEGKGDLAYRLVDAAMIWNVPFVEVAPRHIHLDLRECLVPCLIIGPG